MQSLTLDPITLAPATPANPRRNGKIARLPRDTREMINRMLDDGLPYQVILDELGEAGESINFQNLTNWKQGGYQDWLKNQELAEQTRVQVEAIMDLIKENPELDSATVMKACHMLGAVQLFTAIRDQGDDAIKNLLLDKPEKYISLLSLVCRVADTGLRIDKFNRETNTLKELLAVLNQGESSQFKPEHKTAEAGTTSPAPNPATTTPFKVIQGNSSSEENHARSAEIGSAQESLSQLAVEPPFKANQANSSCEESNAPAAEVNSPPAAGSPE